MDNLLVDINEWSGGKKLLVAVVVVYGTSLVGKYLRNWWQWYKFLLLRREKRDSCGKAISELNARINEELSARDDNFESKQNEIIDMSFEDLTASLRDGKFTATDVLLAYQRQALKTHGETNCLIEPLYEAEPLAVACDQKKTNKRALHGIPVSLKDNYGLAGYDSTVGCSRWINKPFKEDAVIVQVLKKQGAIPFVKTNVPQTMISMETTNPIFGATTNIHDKHCKRSVGGSSGGEGALLSGKGSILGFGSDIGGSIRIPCHMSGVYGLKPTAGRLSSKGTHPIYKGQTCLTSSYGPMARDIETLVSAMRALCVPYMYELDPTIPSMPFRDEILQSDKKLCIGFYMTDNFFHPIPAMQRGVLEAKQALERMGHKVIPWEFPDLGWRTANIWGGAVFGDSCKELKALLKNDSYDSAMHTIVTAMKIPPFVRRFLGYVLGFIFPQMAKALTYSCGLNGVSGWWNLMKEQKAFRDDVICDWRKKGIDAVIAPGFGTCALPVGKSAQASGCASYTWLYNVIEFPAGSLPVTKVTRADCEALKSYPTPDPWHYIVKKGCEGSEGLPVNVQVAALPWQEELCLRVMKEVERGLQQ